MKLVCLFALILPLAGQTVTGSLAVSGTAKRAQRAVTQRIYDNRPIAMMFVGGGDCDGSSNPPGNKAPNGACIADITNHAAYLSAMISRLDELFETLDAMSPRPKGIIFWDADGYEFLSDTYLGHPSKIPLLNPHFDAIADDFFSYVRSRGYELGFTIRPHILRVGVALPGCYLYPPDTGTGFKAMGEPYGMRAWQCSQSTFQWSQAGGQGTPSSERTALKNLSAEVSYTHQRWGATLFYADSTFFALGQVGPHVWAEMLRAFPDCSFFPENVTVPIVGDPQDHFLYSRPYRDQTATWTPGYTGPYTNRLINITNHGGGADSAVLAEFVKAGSSLLFQGGVTDAALVEEVYAAAGY